MSVLGGGKVARRGQHVAEAGAADGKLAPPGEVDTVQGIRLRGIELRRAVASISCSLAS